MGLRDLLKKKDNLNDEGEPADRETVARLAAPEVTFIRSDTVSQEVIYPPNHPVHEEDDNYLSVAGARDGSGSGHKPRRSLDVFRSSRSRSASVSSRASDSSKKDKEKGEGKRLSQRLHLSRSPASSEAVPDDLPEIVTTDASSGVEDRDGTESQWEQRATILARENEKHRSRPSTPVREMAGMGLHERGRGRADGQEGGTAVSTKEIDDDIQEAIRLHEEGDLERSTAMFGRLANPNGANNPLSQVLYGLALR
jgi:hypothetical protein